MKQVITKGNNRLEIEISGDWAGIDIHGSDGYYRGASLRAVDLKDKLEELLKLYTYTKGEKSHKAQLVREAIAKAGA